MRGRESMFQAKLARGPDVADRHSTKTTHVGVTAGLHNTRPERAFPMEKNFAEVRLQILSEFPPRYNEIDFCGPRRICADQFSPSSFPSCAELRYSMPHTQSLLRIKALLDHSTVTIDALARSSGCIV